jgi:hypothetical protein
VKYDPKVTRVTSHKVKFTHPPDGHCHFSQDGKVKTVVRNDSARLDLDLGHIFSVDVQGIEELEVAGQPDLDRSKYEVQLVPIADDELSNRRLHVTAYWSLLGSGKDPEIATSPLMVDDGVPQYVMAPHKDHPHSDHLLLLRPTILPVGCEK